MNKLIERYALLDEEDRMAIETIMGHAVDTLSSDSGTLIFMFDVNGDGTAEMLAAGNPLLIQPLLHSAGVVGTRIFAQPEGMVQ